LLPGITPLPKLEFPAVTEAMRHTAVHQSVLILGFLSRLMLEPDYKCLIFNGMRNFEQIAEKKIHG
jgi:hypothetical protein